jgi:hypothetical protein
MDIRKAIFIVESVGNSGNILMWHGGRIDGSMAVQKPSKGRYEAGPGIYFTTKYATATKYAKGGGSTYLVEIAPNLRFADEVSLPLDDLIKFLKGLRMKKNKEVIADLEANSARMTARSPEHEGKVKASVLINLLVNWEAGSGDVGLEVAKYLADNGVDASVENQSGNEQWLVIFNPKVIKSSKKVSAAEVTDDLRELPRVK